jgi:hypothetical protein
MSGPETLKETASATRVRFLIRRRFSHHSNSRARDSVAVFSTLCGSRGTFRNRIPSVCQLFLLDRLLARLYNRRDLNNTERPGNDPNGSWGTL